MSGGNAIRHAQVVHPVNRRITAMVGEEALHPMERDDYQLSSMAIQRCRVTLTVTQPRPTMMTVELQLPIEPIERAEIFDRVTPAGRCLGVVDGGRAKCQAGHEGLIARTGRKPRGSFGSQTTFLVAFEGANKQNLDIKLFNPVGGCVPHPPTPPHHEPGAAPATPPTATNDDSQEPHQGEGAGGDAVPPLLQATVQIPGATSMECAMAAVRVVREALLAGGVRTGEPHSPEFLLIQTRCYVVVPRGHVLNFPAMMGAMRQVYQGQQARPAVREHTANPCMDLVWPLVQPAPDPDRNQCHVSFYVLLNNVPVFKTIILTMHGKPRPFAHGDGYSMLIAGRAQPRHIRYIYNFMREFLHIYAGEYINTPRLPGKFDPRRLVELLRQFDEQLDERQADVEREQILEAIGLYV